MKRISRRATWTGAVLGAMTAFLTFALQAHATPFDGAETEEFHQTYPLSANGRIELENVNGPVSIKAWDRNEVKVDAIKRANRKPDLQEVEIQVHSDSNSLSIRTHYPEHNPTWVRNNPGSVEYALMVPRTARLQDISLVNGNLDVEGVNGDVRPSCVNGRLSARNLCGRTELSTVNGNLKASVD